MPTLAPHQDANQYDPTVEYVALCAVRREWEDDWQYFPELRLVDGTVTSGHGGRSEIHLQTPYGTLSHPWEVGFQTRPPFDLAGWWVRMELRGPGSQRCEFGGRIVAETRELEGDQNGRSGEQMWTAVGGDTLLDRLHISRSYWMRGESLGGGPEGSTDQKIPIEWVPPINLRDEQGTLVGNRSAEDLDGDPDPGTPTDVYLYGRTSTWSHLDYLRYLVACFIDESERDPPGPKWTIGGQYEILADLVTVIELAPTMTAGEILRRLIDPAHGLDYVIRPTEEGFEIHVFSLAGEEHTFNGYTLPRNPEVIRYSPDADRAQVRIERDSLHRYHTIRVLGRRAVCCFSMGADGLPGDQPIRDWLRPKWAEDLTADYRAGAGVEEGIVTALHDAARQADRFREVFLAWGLNPAKSIQDFRAGFTSAGRFDAQAAAETGYQRIVFRTLDWIPLRQGVDYTGDPPYDETVQVAPGQTRPAELRRPEAWLAPPDDYGNEDEWIVHEPVDQLGIGVSALDHEIGVRLHCSPNHLVAEAYWSNAQPTAHPPKYSTEKLVATIAVETDQRVSAEYSLSDEPPPSKGVMEIYDDSIECWYLAPYTIVGTDAQGKLIQTGDQPKVIREDYERIGQVMAGAIARYLSSRARASIRLRGLRPWAGLIGSVLEGVEEGGDVSDVHAPITSVTWRAGDRETETIVAAGHVRAG